MYVCMCEISGFTVKQDGELTSYLSNTPFQDPPSFCFSKLFSSLDSSTPVILTTHSQPL